MRPGDRECRLYTKYLKILHKRAGDYCVCKILYFNTKGNGWVIENHKDRLCFFVLFRRSCIQSLGTGQCIIGNQLHNITSLTHQAFTNACTVIPSLTHT